MTYGKPPVLLGQFDMSLPEVMYYLYLPVSMPGFGRATPQEVIRLPPNVECCRPLIERAIASTSRRYKYAYLSARKGWATPDNPLNRPGWHCDGFGSEDLNFVWWKGPGTRFATGDFGVISDDHYKSMTQFAERINVWPTPGHWPGANTSVSKPIKIDTPPAGYLYGLDPYVVHATPELTQGCMRQYVKVSLSDHKYDLYNNSHNYLFDYEWRMHDRDTFRNDTHTGQRDYSGVAG